MRSTVLAKKSPVASKPPLSRPREKLLLPAPPVVQEDSKPRMLWLKFSSILIVGIVLLSVGSFFALGLLKNFRNSLNPVVTPVPVTTFNVHRTAMYAGLDFTVTSVQYASTFADDDIHSSQDIVRLNMIAANKSPDQSMSSIMILRVCSSPMEALSRQQIPISRLTRHQIPAQVVG